MRGFSLGSAGESARRPCLSAFMDETDFPVAERGPVDSCAFLRFALARFVFLPAVARVEFVSDIARNLPDEIPSAWGRERGPILRYHRAAGSGRPGNRPGLSSGVG